VIADKLTRALVLGSALGVAACSGEGLTLPPEGEPAHITVMHGDGQSGLPGSTLSDSVVVRVTDTRDRPVADATVNFTFENSGAAAAPGAATTDADGIAWSKVTLGSQVGEVGGVAEVPVDQGITPVRADFTVTILPGDANVIALVSGDNQSAPVNSALPAPLVVKVTDESGNPISGMSVTWTAVGGGTVSEATTVTGADGQTSVTRTLGPTAGQQTTQASAEGLAGSPVTFTHTATAGTAAGVNKISGDNQSALAGTALPEPLVVQVLDAQQNPIANAAVTWIVTSGGGSVSAENSNTDAQGFASIQWTLGPAAGANSLNAVVSGVGTATFNATGTAGTPSAGNTSVSASPTSISAGTGTSTVTVTVRDAGNNPVAGVSVSIASSGSSNAINPASAISGGDGVATFTFSSTVAESKTITATAGGVPITDQATINVQRVSSTVDITSDEPDASSVGEQITVEFSVIGSGGTPTGEVTITVSGGPETCSESLTSGSGSCTLTLLFPGTGSQNRRTITATYSGDAQFSGDTDTESHRVDPLPNAPPTAQDDGPYQTNEEAQLTVDAPGVLANDSDAEGPLTAVQASDPPNGSVTLNENGSFTYDPNPNFFGTDQFTYLARDAAGATNSATVTIEVSAINDAPDAVDDPFYTTAPNTPLTAPPGGPSLLENDDDADADVLTVTSTGGVTALGGTVSISQDGSFTYNPPSDAADVDDSFQYTVDDGHGGTATATATVHIS
jgi:Bacterial Ig domain/Bacterial Ig-like domain (group 1)